MTLTTREERESINRLREAILHMWDHRYDVDTDHLQADPSLFPGPTVVDLGPLAIAQSEIIALTGPRK